MTEAEFTGRVSDIERKLYRVSFSILKNDADCKDAMQEATYRAWNNMPKLRDETRFEAWLTSILINECKDIKRRAARHPESELPEQIPAPEVDHSVSEALYSLEKKHRRAMSLHYIDGYNVGEIADMLSVPSGTVKSWLHYGRKKLKTILVAVIITLLLIGAAIAIGLNSTLLSWLFDGTTPPEELQESVKYDVSYMEDEGVKLNIDELLFDANSLAVIWSVTSSRPEPVIYHLSNINITSGEIERGEVTCGDWGVGGPCGDGDMGVLNAELRDCIVGPTMYGNTDMTFKGTLPKEPITVEVEITAYTTDLTPVLYEEEGSDMVYLSPYYPDDLVHIKSLSKNRQYPVSAKGYTNLTHDPAYIKAYDELSTRLEAPDSSSSEDEQSAYDEVISEIYVKTAYIESGLLDYLTTLTVRAIVDPTKAIAHSYSSIEGRSVFEFPDFILSIERLEFYPVSTETDFHIRPTSDGTLNAGLLLADENYNQICPLAFGEPLIENDAIVGFRLHGSGAPIPAPKYVNILVSDKETVGSDWLQSLPVGV